MKTIVLFSSANKEGNTAQAVASVEANHEFELIDIDDMTITPYNYGNQYPDDDFHPLIERLLDADNLVFASPVYWYSVTAPMKAFIDRLTELLDVKHLRPTARALATKRGFLIASSGSAELCPTFHGLFSGLFAYFDIPFVATLHAPCQSGFSLTSDEVERFNQILNQG
ncbi:NAD(P)H-dependent oxidoreductase [Vibrio sp. JPW-9-11-11]|uniref:flavodoxin family protein n=1 Tax=Vibrio sp. JPW-9-11-11 TaxID=1416532 RepID=UPI0015945BFD|nr:NAD(P)H-dependent oxidoreductase [Vibrio sp. JPW-9-11-11]NVD07715.1 NAD(P)H-dependent oxidoreductase [Vibrio sp. JPW-9-11-11]